MTARNGAFTDRQDSVNHVYRDYEDDAFRRDNCRHYFVKPRYLDSIDIKQNMSSAIN